MFANTNLFVMNLGFPDVCIVGIIPVPLVNIDFSITNIPTVFNVLYGGGLAENLITISALSTADVGVGVGAVARVSEPPGDGGGPDPLDGAAAVGSPASTAAGSARRPPRAYPPARPAC